MRISYDCQRPTISNQPLSIPPPPLSRFSQQYLSLISKKHHCGFLPYLSKHSFISFRIRPLLILFNQFGWNCLNLQLDFIRFVSLLYSSSSSFFFLWYHLYSYFFLQSATTIISREAVQENVKNLLLVALTTLTIGPELWRTTSQTVDRFYPALFQDEHITMLLASSASQNSNSNPETS